MNVYIDKSIAKIGQFYKKNERLSQQEIKKIFSKGKKIKYYDYLVLYLRNNVNYPRLAVSLKSKLGKSVYRNKEKRIIKEVFRKHKFLLPAVNILVIKLRVSNLNFKEKQEQLINLYRMIKL